MYDIAQRLDGAHNGWMIGQAPKIDTLSPALLAGLVGIAVTGDEAGFFYGAVGVWFMLTCAVVAVAWCAARSQRDNGSEAVHVPAE